MTFTENGKEYVIAPPDYARFYLIEFYPSEMRDEKINVGVVGVGKGGTRSYVVSDAAWGRIGVWCGWTEEMLWQIRRHIAEIVRRVEKNPAEVEEHPPRVYHRVVLHRQGGSLGSTENEIDVFVGYFCYLAEGKTYGWLRKETE
jgi:hypothetical protein